MDSEERLLIERAKRDPDAFGVLYERYVERIYNYVFYRVGNEQDAQDLTARVFYRALAHMDSYRDRGAPFAAWLYRIAHNLVANWYRDQSRRRELRLDDVVLFAEKSKEPDQMAERHDESRVLLDAIRQLPGERQTLLILKFVDELSNAEIGRILGRSESAVKSLYHRTLVALRQKLEGQIE